MTINAQVADVVDEGVRAARRAMTESRHAVEDVRDRAALRLRRNPWRTLGIAAVVGFSLGSLAGGLVMAACGRSRGLRS